MRHVRQPHSELPGSRLYVCTNTAGDAAHPPHITQGWRTIFCLPSEGERTRKHSSQANIHGFWECCRSIFLPLSPPYDMFTKYLLRMRQRLRRALPSSPRGCSAVNGGIICQLWQCLEAASERYKEATDKESIRRAVNCLQSPGAGEYLKSMGLKTD